ncbi:MAG: hypothetical protein OEX19_17470, partial [Gammaproteobacteria bacterium]|nr:hypothetical protein [Gammaproteobacteria bacterium]
GLILTAMVDPPVSTRWMAIANGMGILLGMLAVLGKRIVPVMQGTPVISEPRMVTNTVGLLIGLGASITAIAYPPVSTIWAAYVQIAAIALVVQGIIGYDFLMKASSAVGAGTTPAMKAKHARKAKISTKTAYIPKAA